MTEKLVFESRSEEETAGFGRQFALSLESGITVALNGQLGAGKTNFVRGVCAGLGIASDLVNSPTFVLLQLYTDGRLPVAHFDIYRLADVDEFLGIGGEDFLLDPEMICFVEWADRIADVMPRDHLRIDIGTLAEEERSFTLTANGKRSTLFLKRLRDRMSGA